MGFFKAAIKAVKGDMLGATSEMLPDAIKDQGKEVIQETAADYLESRDIKGVGKRMFNNTLTRLAGDAKPPKDSISQSLPQDEKAFMVYVNNEQYGPFNTNEMKQLVEGNEIDKDTLVWQKGMDNWQPACEVKMIAKLFPKQQQVSAAMHNMPKTGYFVNVNNQQVGPFTVQQLQQFAQAGEFTQQMFVWREGMTQWQTAGSVQELAAFFSMQMPSMPQMPKV